MIMLGIFFLTFPLVDLYVRHPLFGMSFSTNNPVVCLSCLDCSMLSTVIFEGDGISTFVHFERRCCYMCTNCVISSQVQVTRRLLYNFSTIVGGLFNLIALMVMSPITDKGISSFTASNNARPTHEVYLLC